MFDHAELIRTTKLPNGLTVLTETMPGVESVALGVWADAGSEEEDPREYGQAHFLEHMLFKGTATRTAFDLAEAIEDVGGQLNAFTERETTHLYARILAEHLPLAVDLLADMVCHSAFGQAELDRERQVITEEIRKYESLPEEQIHDLIMAGLWHGGALGHAILGTEATIQTLTREQIIDCWRRHFAADRTLITAAGKVDHDALVERIAVAFTDMPSLHAEHPTLPEGIVVPYLLDNADEEQVHFCWGGRTFPAHDQRNFSLAVIDAVLGASTTSRLFQEIREKRGLAYDVASFSSAFRETGMLCAVGATSPDTLLEVLALVRGELESLRAKCVTLRELARAKEQMKAELALSLESTTERMRRLATHQLTWGRVYPLLSLIDHINAVTMEDVQAVLAEVLKPEQWSFAAIGPMDEAAVKRVIGQ